MTWIGSLAYVGEQIIVGYLIHLGLIGTYDVTAGGTPEDSLGQLVLLRSLLPATMNRIKMAELHGTDPLEQLG